MYAAKSSWSFILYSIAKKENAVGRSHLIGSANGSWIVTSGCKDFRFGKRRVMTIDGC